MRCSSCRGRRRARVVFRRAAAVTHGLCLVGLYARDVFAGPARVAGVRGSWLADRDPRWLGESQTQRRSTRRTAARSGGGRSIGLALALTSSGAWACAVQDVRAEPGLCQQASDHVAACEGAASAVADDCDVEAAQELLDLPCESIDAGKADLLGTVLCTFGVLRHCSVPACDDALTDTHDFADDNCADLIDAPGCAACDYYRCREAQSSGQCADAGYYEGFGYKYCLRYVQVTEPRMSQRGAQWSAATRTCLLEALDDVPDSADCEGLIEAGYDTHPECYEAQGFCDLSKSDVRRIASTIDVEDSDLSLVLSVGLHCFADEFR